MLALHRRLADLLHAGHVLNFVPLVLSLLQCLFFFLSLSFVLLHAFVEQPLIHVHRKLKGVVDEACQMELGAI